MPYKPTGRPAGRPRKDGKAPGSVVTVEVPREPEAPKTPPVSRNVGWMGPQPVILCEECFPDGWGPHWTGVACRHGIWTRRL